MEEPPVPRKSSDSEVRPGRDFVGGGPVTIDRVYLQSQFTILDQRVNGHSLVYLDSAASSQVPKVVIEAFTKHYAQDHANIHRGIHTLAERSTRKYETARETVASFINAKPDEIIFTSGTTHGNNLAAYALISRCAPGDEFVVTEMDHHSNFVVWQELARLHGVILKIIPITPDFRLDVDAAERLITRRTKVVAMPHVSNVLGTIVPAEDILRISKIAHEHGALLLLDGAQAVAHIPVDVKALDVDFYSFSGHKMYAPTGIGVLYVRASVLATLPPFHFGGGMIEMVTREKTTFTQGPARFEAGTPNIAGAICLGVAVDFIKSIGFDTIVSHEQELTKRLLSGLLTIPGIAIIGPHDLHNRSGVISFIVEGMHAHDVAATLDGEGIAVRAGHHCAQPLAERLGIPATVRASFGIYTTTQDIDAIIAALRQLQGGGAEGIIGSLRQGDIGGGMFVNHSTEEVLSDEQLLYRDNLLDHYKHPRNKRVVASQEMNADSKSASDTPIVACFNDVNPSCGDTISVCIVMERGVVREAAFDGSGCAISQAAMSMLTEKIKSMSAADVLSLSREDVLRMLGIPIGIVRMKCALLGLRTTQEAIRRSIPARTV